MDYKGLKTDSMQVMHLVQQIGRMFLELGKDGVIIGQSLFVGCCYYSNMTVLMNAQFF